MRRTRPTVPQQRRLLTEIPAASRELERAERAIPRVSTTLPVSWSGRPGYSKTSTARLIDFGSGISTTNAGTVPLVVEHPEQAASSPHCSW